MHSLFCGVTQSGKTTLARYIARELAKRGQPMSVYDPVGTPTRGGDWPESATMFRDEEKFLEHLADDRVVNRHIFVDEADELFHLARRENFWLLTRGRHFGFSVNLICCRPKSLAPAVRRQCTRVYMFRLAKDDAVEVGRDLGHSDFAAYDFDQGEFLIANSASPLVTRAHLDNFLGKE